MRGKHLASVQHKKWRKSPIEPMNGDPNPQARVPLVSIGASAGGVAALRAFFDALPDRVGAAFVVIVHLDPAHSSGLDRIIAGHTRMPVLDVTHDRRIEADTVYVIPPDRRLLVSAGRISSAPLGEPRGQRSPVDLLFRAVAEQRGGGIAIVLTGAGADGAAALNAVKKRGGPVLVQDPNEAEHPAMPRSAIASGAADLILPVREIAARLPELLRNNLQLGAETLADKDERSLERILAHLKLRSGHDFARYKRATILRRLGRRMQVTRTATLEDYLVHLRAHAGEAHALLGDLLISVTSFFRDAAAFRELAHRVIPELFDARAEGEGLRIWVPGCATGEEAYSIAILLIEECARRRERPEIQLFASDIDAAALAAGREGRYPPAIAADVSEERLRRFFVREGDHYRIKREVRDLVVFAQHSLLRDPPFSRVDLISCRNLLIYLDKDLQSQISAMFHYALKPGGYLFVGASEHIAPALFKTISRNARIFQARECPRELPPLPPVIAAPRSPEPPVVARSSGGDPTSDSAEQRAGLEHTAPPSMLVDEARHVLNVSETAGRFLHQTGGRISNLAVDLVRSELKLDLKTGLQRAFEQGEPTLTLPARFDGGDRTVSLHIRPIMKDGVAAGLAQVLFLEGSPAEAAGHRRSPRDGSDPSSVAQLRNELSAARAHLRASREQYETITEELRASNEELQSINEEYRSTAEELEASKEDLQSMNEELQTLNSELKLKLDAASRAANDLENLIGSTDVATLFLSTTLRIYRFTPRLADIFNVTTGDEGRPVGDLTHCLAYRDLAKDARRVLAELVPVERTLPTHDGRSYLMRMRPYRTLDDKIEGVVLTFVGA